MVDKAAMTSELEDRLNSFFTEEDLQDQKEEQAHPAKEEPLLDRLQAAMLALEWEINDNNIDQLLREIEAAKLEYPDQQINQLFLRLLESITRYIREKKASAHPSAVGLLHVAFQDFIRVITDGALPEAGKKQLLMNSLTLFKKLKEALASGETPPYIPPPPAKLKEEVPPKTRSATPPLRPAPTEEISSRTTAPQAVSFHPDPNPVSSDRPAPARPAPVPTSPIPSAPQPAPESSAFTSAGDVRLQPHEAFAMALQEIKATIEREFAALRAEIRLWRQGQ